MEIKLPIFIWKLLTNGIEETTEFERGLNKYIELIDTTEKLKLSKADKKMFPILKNLWSDIELVEEMIKKYSTGAPDVKKQMYGFIAHYMKTVNVIVEKILEKFTTAEGNILTEKEQDLSWDYTIILGQLHQIMLENPKNLKKIIVGLQTEFPDIGLEE